MNKGLIKEAQALPSLIVEMFASEIGVEWVDLRGLMELQAIIIEEIIDKDVDSPNILLAFKAVQDSVAERWKKWLQESVSDAYGV